MNMKIRKIGTDFISPPQPHSFPQCRTVTYVMEQYYKKTRSNSGEMKSCTTEHHTDSQGFDVQLSEVLQ